MAAAQPRAAQAGRFLIGLIVGLLIGLALALGVALYVTKVPVPFINKVPQRSAEQDAAEAQKNKNWDPNSPLAGKTPMRPVPPPAPASEAAPPAAPEPAPAPAVVPPPVPAEPPVARASAPTSSRDPAAILGERPAASAPARPPTIVSAVPGYDPFTYFVQAGAYGRNEDAEQQRAKLAMLGFEGKLSEREQNGRTVYRVRVGPFERKEDADSTKDRLAGAGIEAALVRVQK